MLIQIYKHQTFTYLISVRLSTDEENEKNIAILRPAWNVRQETESRRKPTLTVDTYRKQFLDDSHDTDVYSSY